MYHVEKKNTVHKKMSILNLKYIYLYVYNSIY